ncbi:MAG TPA: DUF1549 domain-containing protein, partial [Chthoniobacteraceae bacterium]|nr:DUF1549 domain-containing protein [Chthoniobacteraceae bacterium]
MFRIISIFILAGVAWPRFTHAATPGEVEFFETKVRPVLAEHCYKCHGTEKQKAELRLDSRVAILKGSDAGPVVVPGKPEESELIKSVRHEGDTKMPEKEPKLSDAQIAALTEWVKIGLPWPDADTARLTKQEEAARTHWSFQPVKDPPLPPVRDATHWVRSPIDQFILAQLEAAAVTPAPIADRRTLIRRATFDLIGVPPTFAEVRTFESDDAPDAFARLVDRLLASP